MKTADIRAAFLRYFQEKNHTMHDSASLIPAEDPSLLFTNAGMVPFKPYFLGEKLADNPAFTSSQRCLRVGGKHNDLDNVGFTARHHTLFEMLGNFSFGAYEKKEAIRYAWEFLTQVLKLPKEKLWVTVFKEDLESKQIWQNEIGVPEEKIIFCGEKDNFWSMGDTGPCGPCTEIFYDHGPSVAGGPPGSAEEDGDRYVEVWNLVFMEFEKKANGDRVPLPKRCVDTGMGLERIAAVMQGVTNNFDTDCFQNIIQQAQKLAPNMPLVTQRILADHMRAICWLISEQVRPSNEGRGYVLRRVIRRGLRYAYSAGAKLPCLYTLVDAVVSEYGHDQRLQEARLSIIEVLRTEEEAFAQTIKHGMGLFEETVASLKGKTIPGDTVFKLYDTFGFPQDLVMDLARERGLDVDLEGYEQAMRVQKNRSRSNQKFQSQTQKQWQIDTPSSFVGYNEVKAKAQVMGLYQESQAEECKKLQSGSQGRVILDQTPFYAESGGQVGDKGYITTEKGVFRVLDTQKQGDSIVHYGVCESGSLAVDERVLAEVDSQREDTKKNHSATHLLHSALRSILGDHVTQKGSLVTPEKLRFDFSHTKALTGSEKDQIEKLVNEHIMQNHTVTTEVMDLEVAKKANIMALFTEKYEDKVRVLTMGSFSRELCGGTHCKQTGDIGLFVLTQESAVAQGVRRVEALTGMTAYTYLQNKRKHMDKLALLLGCPESQIEEKVQQAQQKLKQLEKALQALEVEQAKIHLGKKVQQSMRTTPQGLNYAIMTCESDEGLDLRTTMDICLQACQEAVVLLFQPQKSGRSALSIGIGKGLQAKMSANDLFKEAGEKLNARGGGKPAYAQGQIPSVDRDDIMRKLVAWMDEK